MKNETENSLAVGCPLERWVMPSDMKDIQVQFFYIAGGEPAFICGAIGHITSELLDVLEKEVNENPLEDTFKKGEGDYLFSAKFQEEQRGDFGRVELPGYWELELIEFRECRDDGA